MRVPQAPSAPGALRLLLVMSVAFGAVGTVIGAQTEPTLVTTSVAETSRLPLLDAGLNGEIAAGTDYSQFSESALLSPVQALLDAPQLTETEAETGPALVMGSTLATALIEDGVVEVFDSAGGEVGWNLTVPTEFGGLRHFLVVGQAGDWLQVQVPVRPNGTTGWIQRSAVTVSDINHRVQVDISDRSVIVWEGDQVVLDTTGAVGRDSAPTPLGSFYIRDIFEWNPESVYGPWVLALSSYSETIDQINGGDAVVAIHGTNDPLSLGNAVSLGCIRLDNDVVTQLAHLVGPGTPIEIVR